MRRFGAMRSWVAAGVVVTVAATGARTASADETPSPQVTDVSVRDGQARVVTEVSVATADVSAQRPQATVTIDGHAVTGVSAKLDAGGVDAQSEQRSVVLAIDTSGSMAGTGLAGAKAAALTYLHAVAPDVRVGVVAFSDTPRVVVLPVTDHRAIAAGIAGLDARGETSMYDGVLAALHVLPGGGQRRIVLLSDGEDTVSHTSLAALLKAIRGAGVVVDTVGFHTARRQSGILQEIAATTHGRRYSVAAATDIAAAFRSAASTLSARVMLTFPVPAALHGRQHLDLVITLGGRSFAASTEIGLPVAATTIPGTGSQGAADRWWGSRSSYWAGLAAIFLALLTFALVVLAGVQQRRRRREVPSLLQAYSAAPALHANVAVNADGPERAEGVVGSAVRSAAERVVQSRGREEAMVLALERAALPLTPAEWVLAQAGVSVIALLVLVLCGLPLLLALLITAALAIFGPRLLLSFRATRRQRAFVAKLPDALSVLAGSLSSGFSLAQALDTLVNDAPEPVAGEMRKAIAASRLGIPIEDALETVADTLDVEEFRWVVMAIRVQRDVGGSLAEVLLTVAATLRDRDKLQRQVRVLTAEGRISAYVLVAMPFALTLFFITFRPAYLRQLYTNAFGVAMIIADVVLVAVGWFWMRRLVKVEI